MQVSDRVRMTRALELAMKGSRSCAPNPMVGCVVVANNGASFEGFHREAGGVHAEVAALDAAGEAARGAEMFVTLEPCSHTGRTPPCVGRVVEAGVAEVHVAMKDPDPRNDGRGIEALREAGVACEVGLLADEAAWLNRGFVSRVARKRPWVRLKTASTMDGRIGLGDGGEMTITCERSRRLVHRMRAESCAVMTGSGTALADDPQLTARDVGAERQPLRFLVDSRARCPAKLRMYEGGAVLVTASDPPGGLAEGVEVLRLQGSDGKVDLKALLEEMAGRFEVNSLMVEAGAGLAGAMLSQGLVDEVSAFVSPRYLGTGMSVADFSGGSGIGGAPEFKMREMRMVGDDGLITLVAEG